MKSLDLRIVLVIIVAIFVGMPTAQAAAGPANVEYGYEPISGIGNGSSSDGQGGVPSVDSGEETPSLAEAGTLGPGFFGILSGSMILILALLIVVVALGWVAWSRYSGRGRQSGMVPRLVALLAVFVALPLVAFGSAQSAKRSPAPKGFYGVITQTDLSATDSTRMARGGVESLRIPLNWAAVQPNNGDEFNWEAIDHLIGQAAKSGISTLPFVYASPRWVTGRDTNLPVDGSAQRRAWKNFLKAAVERYGRHGQFWKDHRAASDDPIPKTPVKKWQIWNEVNFYYFATPVSSKDYVRLLKLSDRAIRQIDPKAKIMLSGLYGRPPRKQVRRGKGMSSYKFLRQIYNRGGKRHFDIAAIHPYTPNTRSTRALLNRFRKVMKRHGDRKTPLSITEVGWGSARKGFLDVGSKRAQAKQVRSAYNYFLRNRHKLKLKSVYWFSWKDKKRSEPSCNFCYSTGFFKAANGLRAKPSWRQFTKFSGGRP